MILRLIITFGAAVLMLTVGTPSPAQPLIAAAYLPDDENFPNPERGFYIQRAPLWIAEERIPLERTELDEARDNGINLIRAYYVLDRHRDRPLDAPVFAALEADLDTIRSAGFKVIPRFSYNFPIDDSYTQAADAPLDVVLGHIKQLEPILRANADIIAHMEAGFIGAWGEWHSSSNRLIHYPDYGLNAASREILFELLNTLPPTRMVAVRYPLIKQQLFGPLPLTAEQAFSGSPQARIAAHEDCFLASDINWGTYLDANIEPQIEAFRTYLHADNRYVVQSGETCNAGPDAQPFIHCDYALPELAYIRWSSINIDYNVDVLDIWRAEGCFETIARRLGYRLRLLEASAPETIRSGGAVLVNIRLINDGFASPYNPRGFKLALRSGDGQIHPLLLENTPDPRFWLPDEPIELALLAVVPAGLPAGTYTLLLSLPDPEPRLAADPRYAIRLANAGLWDADTGWHRLGLQLTLAER